MKIDGLSMTTKVVGVLDGWDFAAVMFAGLLRWV